jgi:hypothetical protein
MNLEAIGDGAIRLRASRDFVRSALILAACIVAVAAILFAVSQALALTGSGGVQGIAIAAAICFLSGIAAEAIGANSHRIGAVAALLAGIGLRLAPPMVICLLLAVLGADGRQHFAFVCYLLAFYLVTLVLETTFAVQRAAASDMNRNLR